MKFLYDSTKTLALVAFSAFTLSACGGGGGSSGGLPGVTTTTPVTKSSPTPEPGPTTVAASSAFTCPTSDTAAASSRSGSLMVARRGVSRRSASHESTGTQVAVTYSSALSPGAHLLATSRATSLGAKSVSSYTFARTGLVTDILSVSPDKVSSVVAKLRMQAGVKSVGMTGSKRYPTSVVAPFLTNDPYFDGFTPSNVGPYYESANSPGQWNLHAIGLDDAFAYSQPTNGSGVFNANALGSSNVKIAVIDTGMDTTHPELHSKITYQRCFITNTNNVQSASSFVTDPDGHGTDVSGIAAAATNNKLGFAGAGGNASIYAYRVYPTPDDNCLSDTSDDQQCGADTRDIASAINDAVSNHVNVISLSLGGGNCTNGVDPDTVEGNAIANAIAANIVVVAAAGNNGTAGLSSPACDPGVIAAGASALADGQPTGGPTTGSSTSPVEYVASYSQYGSPGASFGNASAWGIVAPGGDPVSNTDADDLHWIEDIWTSTPFDQNFSGSCGADSAGSQECLTLIAGTSMSTPTVAGAAALILAVNPAYQSSSKMKTLLCSTAHDIGDSKEGCGRLNIYRAMALAVGDPAPPAQ